MLLPVRGDALLLATRRGGGRRYKPRIVTVLVRDGLPLEVVDNYMTPGEETTAAQKMRELPKSSIAIFLTTARKLIYHWAKCFLTTRQLL